MPCVSDYMEPNGKERRLQQTAQLLMYVRYNTNSGIKVDNKLKRAAADIYCKADYVPELCAAIRALSPEEVDRIVYDGRNPEARKLADWWEEHQAADAERLAKEQREKEEAAARERALAKLTQEERRLLGL